MARRQLLVRSGQDVGPLHAVELAHLRAALQQLHRVGVVGHLELWSNKETKERASVRSDARPNNARFCVARTGIEVKTPMPRKARASYPAMPSSNLVTARSPPSMKRILPSSPTVRYSKSCGGTINICEATQTQSHTIAGHCQMRRLGRRTGEGMEGGKVRARWA